MTNEKWIALLSFGVFALNLLSGFAPLAALKDWFILASALMGGFTSYWFGVRPIRQAIKSKQA